MFRYFFIFYFLLISAEFKNNGTEYILRTQPIKEGAIISVKVKIIVKSEAKNNKSKNNEGGFFGVMIDTLSNANDRFIKAPIKLQGLKNSKNSFSEQISINEEFTIAAKIIRIHKDSGYISGQTKLIIRDQHYFIQITGYVDIKEIEDNSIHVSKIYKLRYKLQAF